MVITRRMLPNLLRLTAVIALGIITLVGAGWLNPPRPAAEPPNRLPIQVVDSAGVLSTAQTSQLQRSIDQLFSDHSIQLWVVYVRTFDGMSAQQWAEKTVTASDLGDRDVLLAVATEDRGYYFSSPDSVDGITQSTLDSIAQNDIVPQLKRGAWDAAAFGAINGLNDALTPSHTGLYVAAGVGGVAVVGGTAAVMYSRRRRRTKIDDSVESLREQDELTAEQLLAQPAEVLDPWSREVLTDTDNAIRTSAEELRLAISEFGEAETAPFTAALEKAKKGLAESYRLRQRLDDDVPETDEERRSMLAQIITTCSDVDSELDEQVHAFDEMRNLLINAPSRFDSITQQLVALRARLEVSQAKLNELTTTYGATTVASITDNIRLATEQITFAEASTDQGRTAISQPVGEQGPAVADIRSAEGAIEQAGRLLDAIDNADSTIAAAKSRMQALIDEVDGELLEAAQLTADGGPALVTAVAAAQTAVTNAKASGTTDPLGTFTALMNADADLDKALDTAREASSTRQRSTQMLTAAIESAAAKVGAASDFIATRRGAVQSVARTRLAEAQRLLDEARSLTSTDMNRAVDSARRSATLADDALMAAQADVASWNSQQQPTQQQGSATGAVLGGILVDSFLRGSMYGRGGGWGGGGGGGWSGGGYSSGGRSPGSFGGSGSSGRIGTGGRF